uniref:Transposase n=1 Tax=Streptococcus suis TaxID=1307 RepID=G8DU54_STRSU|nr:transposase [Streptococcus suis]
MGKRICVRGLTLSPILSKVNLIWIPFQVRSISSAEVEKTDSKLLYWDEQGFWLLYKRFENGKLAWSNNEEEVKALTSEQVD